MKPPAILRLRNLVPIRRYQGWVVSPFSMEFNVNPMASDTDGVLLVAFPRCTIAEPGASVFAMHVIIDEGDTEFV